MNIDTITAEEKPAIQEFREKIADILPAEIDNDFYLRKWLRARNFDIALAEDMFRKHIRFMKGNGLDKILTEEFTHNPATEYFHTARLGYDKEGSVVRIIHVGGADLRGLALSISKRDAFRFATHVIYSDINQQKEDRKDTFLCDKQVYVFDLNGLNWFSVIHRTVVEKAYTLLKSYEANHPENLKVVYVVHAPSFFSFIYNWLKTILPESILSKVEILSDEEIKSAVTKNIDPAILPAAVGGTMTDEDGNPDCQSIYKVPLNTPVPEDLMLHQQMSVLENDPKAKRVTVECGCATRVRVSVKEPNSLIEWDFQTVAYDIRFGLCFREDEKSEPSEIITPHRVESHRFPESGTFSCLQAGLYELVFDNTYSWMTRKELIYKVKVVKPSEIKES